MRAARTGFGWNWRGRRSRDDVGVAGGDARDPRAGPRAGRRAGRRAGADRADAGARRVQPHAAGSAAPAPAAPGLDAHPLDAVAAAAPAPPPPLRGFECTRYLDAGKAPQGPLTVAFRPTGGTDFTYHIEFHCKFNCRPEYGACDYAADIRMENGSFQNRTLRGPFPCKQSTVNALAVDCGIVLGSNVMTVITGRDVVRTVNFKVWSTFDENIPDQKPGDQSYGCLPFVLHSKDPDGSVHKSLIDNYFTFKPEECRVDPMDVRWPRRPAAVRR